jgi:acyl dehydratase
MTTDAEQPVTLPAERFLRPASRDAPWFALRFDELAVGMRTQTAGRTVTEADVVLFGGITGQLHPIHTDAHHAATTPVGHRTPQGMLLVSYALGLLPLHDSPAIVLRQFKDITFKRPGRIGMTIHAAARVASLRPLDDATGLVETRLDLLDEEDRLVARGAAIIVWAR